MKATIPKVMVGSECTCVMKPGSWNSVPVNSASNNCPSLHHNELYLVCPEGEVAMYTCLGLCVLTELLASFLQVLTLCLVDHRTLDWTTLQKIGDVLSSVS